MNRLLVISILFVIVRVTLPADWLQHHRVWSYALPLGVGLLGGVLYNFRVVLDNARNIRARWAWHAKEQNFGLIVILSWLAMPFFLLHGGIEPLQRIKYLLFTELVLLGLSPLSLFCHLFFADDKEEIEKEQARRNEYQSEWQEERLAQKEFFLFRAFFFPFTVFHSLLWILGWVWMFLAEELQTLHTFSVTRGLPEDATAWRRAAWWSAHLARQTFAALWSLVGALARFLKNCLIATRDAVGRLICFILAPMEDRALLALLEIVGVVLYARMLNREGNLIIHLVGGTLLAVLHATAGPRLAERLRKHLNQ